jgi:formylglycine-generating enzyme required for sulfatase activity
VTVKQYLAFCAATGHARPPVPTFDLTWGQDDHPIVNVSWNDAMAYCAWLSQATGYTVSLPTEAQWEKAARGGDGRTYPWGNDWDSSKLQCSKATFGDSGGTASVGSYPSGASPHGVLDMAGNVWQWCSDWYDATYYKSSPDRNPAGPPSSPDGVRVLRGGSWYNGGAELFRCVDRSRDTPDDRLITGGFRCVVRADTH